MTDERKDELLDFVYESEESEGYSGDDVSIIGYYADEEFLNYMYEDTLGKENFGGKVKFAIIELRTNEGWQNPHIHIINEKINIAIRLDVPEYFIHPRAKGTFTNNKQKEMFDEFMRSTIPGANISRWNHARNVFNVRFPDHMLKVTEQPDYTKLP